MRLTGAVACFFLALSLAFGASAAKMPSEAERASDTNVVVDSRGAAPAREGVSPGSPADQKRYAAREVASPDAKNFKGGDVIVIGASAVAVVLLVVLVIILL
jgi:hypothetical protein